MERKLLILGRPFLSVCTDKSVMNAYENACEMDFEKTLNFKPLKLLSEMDASLVGAPDFKPARGVLTLS